MALAPLSSDAVLTPEQRAARRAAANTPPPGTSIVGPTAGKNPLAFGTGNTFNVGEGQEVRVVDAGGNVIFSGSGVEGANQAVAVAQSLSDDLGKDANFKIQTGERTINPDGSVGGTRYIDVARAAPSQSGLGFLADTVLPFAASFIPGIGPIAGAALGSAASSAAQGRGLQDALMRAAIAGGSAYAGGQLFGPATPGATPTPGGNIANTAIPTGAAIPPSAFDGILVNATRAVAPNLVGSTLGSTIGTGLSSVTGYKTPAEKFAEQPVQEPVQPPLDDTIVVSGTRASPVVPNYGGALAGVVSPIATEFLPKSVLPEPLPSEPAPVDDTIVVTAPKSVLPPSPIFGVETALPAITGGALTAAQTGGTPPSDNKFDFNDVLGTGLTLPQLISIGGIGADLLGNLIGGGGGAGTGTPYVSPFGTGAGLGLGAGQDMRANPNIIDYERYGFGPEAMFFQPGYGLLNSAAPAPAPAPAPQAQPIMATNPRYEPLI